MATSYIDGLPLVYDPDVIGSLAEKGDASSGVTEGLYPAICALQDLAIRETKPQLDFAIQYKDLAPCQFPWISITLTVGVGATYTGGVPVSPRNRGLPYQSNDAHHCLTIGEKFWNDIKMGRMFICSTRSVGSHAPVEATPHHYGGQKESG